MSSSPEQTRTVGDDVKIHAPKPSLPAQSAKQRVMTVTRTDSDKAASFGIGKPSSDDAHGPSSNRSLKKKASTISQLSTTESHADDEHGIPEIGQQVPMFPNAGDVQAPSPAPGSSGFSESRDKNHKRRTSSRGTLPPGSYGLHGHGLQPLDKLEKQYFQKHPDLLKREHTPHHYDRPYDFSMSSEDLNKIVRETASHGSGIAVKNYAGTPTDQVGWQAIEESTSRVTSPRPASAAPRSPSKAGSRPVSQAEEAGHRGPEEGEVIHVDDPNSRRRSVMFNEEETPAGNEEDEPVYNAPILAEDEILKGPASDTGPAVEPRRGSFFDEESASGHPPSRPTSRPGSLYKVESHEHQSTPLEDVEEYEPLFPEEEGKESAKKPIPDSKRSQGLHKQRFPSRDIWEDAPDSVHYTVEVSTPDIPEEKEPEEDKSATSSVPVPRDGETPAQAFARHQEELAEKEATKNGADTFLKNGRGKPSWAQHQLASETSRPSMAQRFPSRDVWEDTPDSHMLETTVSTPQQDRDSEPPAETTSKPAIPDRPVRKTTDPSTSTTDKPAIPERPKPKSSTDDSSSATPPARQPSIPDRPKPQVPARPVKASPTSGGQEPADAAAPPKQKPAVPLKSVGSKIAALQGSFLNDLNKKLGLGPQAPKKEEPAAEDEDKPAEEKAPLSDARKSRARGPARRAPAAKSPAPSAGEEQKLTLGFAVPSTIFEIDPEEDNTVKLGHAAAAAKETVPAESESKTEEEEPQPEQKEEKEPLKVDESDKPSAPAPEPEKVESVSEVKKPITTTEEDSPAESSQPVKEETKSLVNNSAGDTVLAEDIKVDEEKQEVQPTGTES
ncbi:altered inheritance of mitochondria protein 21 [Coniochaeta sp. 2T2.1]|nr:altered inheritance of mitochondria protein 21 [Coniochaeta sp. 2T2.1]